MPETVTESPVQPVQPVQPAQVQAPVEPTDAEKLHANFKAIDPLRNGVGLDKIRPFYPRVGWNKILGWCAELESAGKLAKRVVLNKTGGVAYHLYDWKE